MCTTFSEIMSFPRAIYIAIAWLVLLMMMIAYSKYYNIHTKP